MTPERLEELRDRIARARSAAYRSGMVDPYVLALAELGTLLSARFAALEAANDINAEQGAVAARLRVIEHQLRVVIGMPYSRRASFADVAVSQQWGGPVLESLLPVVEFDRPRGPWWRRAWTWLWHGWSAR